MHYYQHPAFISLLVSVILLFCRKYKIIFNILTIAYPLVIIFSLYNLIGSYQIDFLNFTFSNNFDPMTKFVGMSICFVLMATGLYAANLNRQIEVVMGAILGASSFFTLFSDEFIIMILGMEFMSIIATFYIFAGQHADSITSAKKYFLLHLTSSNMIMIAIAYLIIKNNYADILPVSLLYYDHNYSQTILTIMLIGSLINVAATPFSFWMTNYYPTASSTAFILLIAIPTKIAIIVLLKLFPGFELLQYVGIVMILYSGIRAIFEDHIQRLLCYLSIVVMGFLLIAISIGTPEVIHMAGYYLAIHILYKSLLALISAYLIEKHQIYLCSELSKYKIKSPVIFISGAIAVLIMLNIPFSNSFYSKILITNEILDNNMLNIGIILSGILTALALPLRCLKFAPINFSNLLFKKSINKHLNLAILSILILLLPLIYFSFKSYSQFTEIYNDQNYAIIKQSLIIILSLLLAYIIKIPKYNYLDFDLIELLKKLYTYGDNLYSQTLDINKNQNEPWSIWSLERQIIRKIANFHNQRTAIIIVFVFLIIMTWYLITM